MNRYWFIVIGILLLGVSGCGRRFRLSPEQMAEPSAWPFYRGGVAALGSLEEGDFDGRLDVIWEQGSGDKPGGPLALHYGVLVYPGSTGKIRFYDGYDGSYRGRWRAGSSAQTGLAMQDSLAFFCTAPAKDKLYCVDLRRRASIWDRPVKDATTGTIIVDNRLIVGSAAGVLSAFDVTSGRELWSLETSGRFAAPPSFGAGKLFQPGDDGTLYCLSPEDGSELYRVDLGGPLVSAAAVSDLVYVTDMAGTVYAIEPEDGHIVWRTRLDGHGWTSPAVSADLVFVGHSGGEVVALNAATGKPVWRFRTEEVVRASVIVVGRVVVVGTMGGKLFSLDAATGVVLATRQLRGAIARAPVTDGERVYVATQNGRITCFGNSSQGPEHEDQREHSADGSQ